MASLEVSNFVLGFLSSHIGLVFWTPVGIGHCRSTALIRLDHLSDLLFIMYTLLFAVRLFCSALAGFARFYDLTLRGF